MIYIFCAIKDEALCLKELVNDDCTLVITGVGKVNAAYSVGKVFGNKTREDCKNDYVINFGCACSKNMKGTYFANKITDISTNRDFYPDMIRIEDANEALLFTSDVVVHNPTEDRLYDMEASSIFECASKHLSPDRIFIIKCVSDNGELDNITKESIVADCEEGRSLVNSVVENIRNIPCEKSYEFELPSKLHLTSTMISQFKELKLYADSVGFNLDEYISERVADSKKLSKKETMEVLDDVRQILLS